MDVVIKRRAKWVWNIDIPVKNILVRCELKFLIKNKH